jgi:hypothetical protein
MIITERHPETSTLRCRASRSVPKWPLSRVSPPTPHYDRRRQAGDRHAAAQRNLFNRFMGMLFHCLRHRHPYDETKAFPIQQPEDHSTAAA